MKVKSQKALLKAINEIRAILSDRARMEAILAEGVVPHFEKQLMSSISPIISAFDVSMSFDWMDDVHGRGKGPISRFTRCLTRSYDARNGRLMLHGSSLANIGIGLALRARLGRPLRMIVDRSCHASVAGSLALASAEVLWLQRRYHHGLTVQPPFMAEDVMAALKTNGKVDVVWLTLPTYDGILPADIEAIRRACDEHDAMLIIDSAWGANLGLLEQAGFPPSPARHAHATVISLHKHGLGLSGASVVLFNDTALMAEFDRFCDAGLSSTSPPFYAVAVLEAAYEAWQGDDGQQAAKDIVAAARAFQAAMADLPGIVPVTPEGLERGFVCDPSHQLFLVRDTGFTGYHILQELGSTYRIDAEKATLTSILFLFGPEQVSCWPQIVEAVREILSGSPGYANPALPPLPPTLPPVAMTMNEAMFRDKRTVSPTEAVGRVAGQMVAAYPPGSALFQPGEIIRQIDLDYLRALQAAGSRIKGIDGPLDEIGLTIIDEDNSKEI